MTRLLLAFFIASALQTSLLADPAARQINTTSWHGLTGLFVIPTARTLGDDRFAVGFNESKHTEYRNGGKFTDRQIRGVLTYAINDDLELAGTYYNDVFTIPSGVEPSLNNQRFYTIDLKWKIVDENCRSWVPAIALAVRDINNRTDDVGPLDDVGNGRKFFLLASKRLAQNNRIGRFLDFHSGISFDHNATAALVGLELTLAPNASLIAEWMWDSPYMNFKDYGQNDREGRFIFNPGLRLYPELVPGLALDMGFVGDSEFEFSFGISYVTGL